MVEEVEGLFLPSACALFTFNKWVQGGNEGNGYIYIIFTKYSIEMFVAIVPFLWSGFSLDKDKKVELLLIMSRVALYFMCIFFCTYTPTKMI